MSTTREALRIRRRHWAPLSLGIVPPILGLFFIIGGAYLIALGGTVHYLLVGRRLTASGFGPIAARGWSLRGHFIVLLGTLVWVLLQVGFERFGLASRLWLPVRATGFTTAAPRAVIALRR